MSADIPKNTVGDASAWREAIDPEKLAAGREALANGGSPEDMVNALDALREKNLDAIDALKGKQRGRPPLPKNASPVDDDLDPVVETGLDIQARASQLANAATKEIVGRSLDVAGVVGQIQAFDYMHKMTGIGLLKLIADIKERKAYKGATLRNRQGELVEVSTFEEFCEALGQSRSKVDGDLQNLREFGESFLESSQRMGLGYRQLRQLRALPEEDRALVIEGEKVGNDPEALKDLLEELVVKQARDKEDLKKEIKEARADLEASREVAAENAKKLSSTREELARIKNINPDERELLQAEKEREALKKLSEERLLLRGAFVAYLARARAVLELDDVGQTTAREVVEMTSALCSGMADDIFAAGIDIDFRILAYPMSCPERGDEIAGAED